MFDLVDNIKIRTKKTIYYFLTISQAAFTFLKCQKHQAIIIWTHGGGSKNCSMDMLFYMLLIKSR